MLRVEHGFSVIVCLTLCHAGSPLHPEDHTVLSAVLHANINGAAICVCVCPGNVSGDRAEGDEPVGPGPGRCSGALCQAEASEEQSGHLPGAASGETQPGAGTAVLARNTGTRTNSCALLQTHRSAQHHDAHACCRIHTPKHPHTRRHMLFSHKQDKSRVVFTTILVFQCCMESVSSAMHVLNLCK